MLFLNKCVKHSEKDSENKLHNQQLTQSIFVKSAHFALFTSNFSFKKQNITKSVEVLHINFPIPFLSLLMLLNDVNSLSLKISLFNMLSFHVMFVSKCIQRTEYYNKSPRIHILASTMTSYGYTYFIKTPTHFQTFF